MKRIAKMTVAVAFATLAVPTTAKAAEPCPTMEQLTIATLEIGSRVMQFAIGIANGYFSRHCLNVKLVSFDSLRDLGVVLGKQEADATDVIEPVAEAYYNAGGAELPVIYGVATYESGKMVGTAPLGDLVGKVMPIGRCSEVKEYPGGKLWGDVTSIDNEDYGKKSPSLTTMLTNALVREAIKNGTLPDNTRLICGKDFTEGFRPDIGGRPAVYVEQGYRVFDREQKLREGVVVATHVHIELVPKLRLLLPNLVVYPDVFDKADLFAAGLYAYPSVYDKKRAAFCQATKALQEINTDLLAGKIADKPFTELTLDDLDKKAQAAFKLFESAIAFDSIPNQLPGLLTIKKTDGIGVNDSATLSAKLETFAQLRGSYIRPSLSVGAEDLKGFAEAFRLKRVPAYKNPCE